LDAHAVSVNSESNSLFCTSCTLPLDLHQPDEENPLQLLGTCNSCSRWFFLLEGESEWDSTILLELPAADEIRSLIGSQVVPD
jgi:hypothetical protein